MTINGVDPISIAVKSPGAAEKNEWCFV